MRRLNWREHSQWFCCSMQPERMQRTEKERKRWLPARVLSHPQSLPHHRKCGSAPYSQETPESGETARLHSVPIPWPLLSTRATVATRCCCSLLLFLTHWPTALAATRRRACAVSTDVPRLRGVRSLTECADEAAWLPASAAEADQIKSPITIEFNWESITRGIPSRGHLRRSARRRRP